MARSLARPAWAATDLLPCGAHLPNRDRPWLCLRHQPDSALIHGRLDGAPVYEVYTVIKGVPCCA
jgi:hypothetical protein